MKGSTPRPLRMKQQLDTIRSGLHKHNPQNKGESESAWANRLQKLLNVASLKATRNWAKGEGTYTNIYKPNGAKECARRIKQLAQGRISNYYPGCQYPGPIQLKENYFET